MHIKCKDCKATLYAQYAEFHENTGEYCSYCSVCFNNTTFTNEPGPNKEIIIVYTKTHQMILFDNNINYEHLNTTNSIYLKVDEPPYDFDGSNFGDDLGDSSD